MVSVRAGYTQIYYYVGAQILLGAHKILGPCQNFGVRCAPRYPLKVQGLLWQPSFVIAGALASRLEVPLTLRSEVHGPTCCVRTSIPAAPSPLSVLD